jgi:hypothetical protein
MSPVRRASVIDTMCGQSAGLCGDWRTNSAPGARRSVVVGCRAELAAAITLSVASMAQLCNRDGSDTVLTSL